MKLSARQLTWATLDRQLLLERSDLDVVAAVKHLGALQAQEPASPYLAVWNRLADFDFSDLDRALADRAIVKCPLMRITLHAVAVSDRANPSGFATERSALQRGQRVECRCRRIDP